MLPRHSLTGLGLARPQSPANQAFFVTTLQQPKGTLYMATLQNDHHHQIGFAPIVGALQGAIRAHIEIAEPHCICCEAPADMVLISPFPSTRIFTDVQLCWSCYETAKNEEGAFPYLGSEVNSAYQCPQCEYILNGDEQTAVITADLASQPFSCPSCRRPLQRNFHHAGCGKPAQNYINLRPHGS